MKESDIDAALAYVVDLYSKSVQQEDRIKIHNVILVLKELRKLRMLWKSVVPSLKEIQKLQKQNINNLGELRSRLFKRTTRKEQDVRSK